MSSTLSIIVPLFNEENRIPLLVKGMDAFHRGCELPFDSIEWILVDDGSVDGTWNRLQVLAEELDQAGLDRVSARVTCKQLSQNSGKGAALKSGVVASSGDWVLTLDADMATDPLTLNAWIADKRWDLTDMQVLHIGSRVHSGSQVKDSLMRHVMGRSFNLLTRLVCGPLSVGDSQCGFKLYPGDRSRILFSELKCMGWAHDVELLLRAQESGLEIRENPVDWEAVDDSRVDPVKDAFRMLFQVVQIRLRLIRENLGKQGRDPWFMASAFLVLACAALIFLSYPQRGIPIDDPVQQLYGEYCAEWYASGFKDERALSLRNLDLYGGAFEVWPGYLHKAYPDVPIFPLRRLVGALVGLLGVVAAWRLTHALSRSTRASFFVAALLLLNPFFVGHQVFNSKDGPFAVFYLWCLYYLVVAIQRLPSWSIRTSAKIGFTLGLLLGVRVGGVLIIPPIALGIAWALWQCTRSGSLSTRVAMFRLLSIGSIVFFVGYATMLAAWPAAQVAPFAQPWEALTSSVKFGWNGQVRFFGELPRAAELPRYYDPLLLVLQTPEVFLLGVLAFVVATWGLFCGSPSKLRTQVSVVIVAGVLPLITVVAGGAILFDKARHILFVIGPFAVLSAVGWNWVFTRGPQVRRLGMATMGLLFILPLVRTVQLHPYQYAYFNELAGGHEKGYKDFGADYWFLSGWEALVALDDFLTSTEDSAESVAVYFPGLPNVVAEFSKEHPRIQSTLNKENADFFAVSTRVDIDKMFPGEVIARVQRFDFDLFLVKDVRGLSGTTEKPSK
ncbi:MAG: glycosyltransferase [bacterium]|nr:glycosyltransferase [bacterium]